MFHSITTVKKDSLTRVNTSVEKEAEKIVYLFSTIFKGIITYPNKLAGSFGCGRTMPGAPEIVPNFEAVNT